MNRSREKLTSQELTTLKIVKKRFFEETYIYIIKMQINS